MGDYILYKNYKVFKTGKVLNLFNAVLEVKKEDVNNLKVIHLCMDGVRKTIPLHHFIFRVFNQNILFSNDYDIWFKDNDINNVHICMKK